MRRRRNFICDPADLVLWSADVTLIRSPGAAVASVCVLVASLLAGCSTSDGIGSFIVDPGHYSVYHCDGLAARLKVLLAREQELANLMNRASEGGGGVLIGNLAYRTDYENAVELPFEHQPHAFGHRFATMERQRALPGSAVTVTL